MREKSASRLTGQKQDPVGAIENVFWIHGGGEYPLDPSQKEYLRVANVEGQPLRELTTTPSVCRAGDRVPENPLEPLSGDRQVSFMIGVAYVSSTTPGIEHYSPSFKK